MLTDCSFTVVQPLAKTNFSWFERRMDGGVPGRDFQAGMSLKQR
jgi:hypothetical protein